jgi:putative colanic acid biosynthesis acetyltransferase WcaF
VSTSTTTNTDVSGSAGKAGGGGARPGDGGNVFRQERIFQQLDLCTQTPYERSHYVKRALWVVVERTLFRYSPRKAHGFRVWLLNKFGAKCHPTVLIRPSAKVRHPWLLTLDEHASIADDVNLYNLGSISVGAHSVISQSAHICAGTHDYTKPDLPLVRPSIVIGRGVWICAEAFVGPGVTIGDNVIVGARGVVTRDIPAGVIAGGNPAKVLRERPMPGINC